MQIKDVLQSQPKKIEKVCRGVGRIIKPLTESFNITFFSYKRIDEAGNLVFLTNHFPWLKQLVKKQYIQYLNSYDYQQDAVLWDGINQDELIYVVLKDAKDNYNIAHGITLVRRFENCLEHFNFATTRNNSDINNFYISSLPLLDRFIIYFREKSKPLINIVENYAVNIKEIFLLNQENHHHEFYADIDYFIEHTNIRTINIEVMGEIIPVNSTLAKCGYYLLQGSTYKHIAKKMYVSEKTIEARLAKLRHLLHVKNKKELIDVLSQAEILQSLELAFLAPSP